MREWLVLHEPVDTVARLSPDEGGLSLGLAFLYHALLEKWLPTEELAVNGLAGEGLVHATVDEVVAAVLLLACKVDANARAH